MYDVVIIGAGSAGLSARREVSLTTENYLVVDDGPLGTTCARVGCMPSKVLIEAGEMLAQTKNFATIGVTLPQAPIVDGRRVMEYVRSRRDHYVGHVVKDMQKWMTTNFLAGRAKFTGPDAIEVDGKEIKAKRFIIATGSHPIILPPWREAKGLLTTDEIFEIADLPKSLVVIGMGPVGLELGHAFARFGVRVTVFGEQKKLGGLSDAALLASAGEAFSRELELVDASVDTIENTSAGFKVVSKKKTVEAEHVLVAVGRKPNVDSLQLERTGAKKTADGNWDFSPQTMRLAGSSCYFVGDVNKDRPILHEAVDQGRIAGANAVRSEDIEYPCKTRLSIVFTQPQIGIVGQTRTKLDKSGIAYATGSASYKNQGRAVAKLKNVGEIKIYAATSDGKILGAELFAPEGEHLSHLLAWAIEADRTVFCLLANPFYHPTIEEGLRSALKEAARQTTDGVAKLTRIRCDESPADSSDESN